MSLTVKSLQVVDVILANVVWRKYANVGSCEGRAHCILHTCVYNPGITQNMDRGETFKWFTVTFVMEWEFLQQSAGQHTGNTVTVHTSHLLIMKTKYIISTSTLDSFNFHIFSLWKLPEGNPKINR